jgi:hypothetical protein
MVGRAMDFFIPGVALEGLRVIALRMQRGGVGYYPSSGSPFVHLDTGSVRHWPRMSREQLARVFPDGRTVHIPTDGQPLAGYAVALADIERRGGSASGPSLEAARHAGAIDGEASSQKPKRSLLAWLFGPKKDEEDDSEAAAAAAPTPATARASNQRATPAKAQPATRMAQIPLPPPRPAAFQVASAAPPAAAPRTVATTRVVPGAAPTANDIINLRGFWEGLPPTEPMVTASADPSVIRPPMDIPSVPDTTASIGAAPPDRVAPELALAYAAEPSREWRPRAMAANAAMVRLPARAAEPATTIAVKGGRGEPAVLAKPASAASARARLGERYDDPWLRAMVWAPNARQFMTTTLFTPPDFRQLQPLLRKPPSSVMMTFSTDPHLGLVCERFGGSAIVFMSTVTFGMRTAALR